MTTPSEKPKVNLLENGKPVSKQSAGCLIGSILLVIFVGLLAIAGGILQGAFRGDTNSFYFPILIVFMVVSTIGFVVTIRRGTSAAHALVLIAGAMFLLMIGLCSASR